MLSALQRAAFPCWRSLLIPPPLRLTPPLAAASLRLLKYSWIVPVAAGAAAALLLGGLCTCTTPREAWLKLLRSKGSRAAAAAAAPPPEAAAVALGALLLALVRHLGLLPTLVFGCFKRPGPPPPPPCWWSLPLFLGPLPPLLPLPLMASWGWGWGGDGVNTGPRGMGGDDSGLRDRTER